MTQPAEENVTAIYGTGVCSRVGHVSRVRFAQAKDPDGNIIALSQAT
jgi:hypothetical protein